MRISRRAFPLIPGFLIGIVAFGGIPQAKANIFDESSFAGGDFPATGNPNIGSLGVGVNTITGVLALDFLDQDTFSVTLPTGLEITSGYWAITGTGGATTFSGTPSGTVDEPLGGLTNINSSGTLNLTGPYTTAGALDVEVAGLEPCQGTPIVCTYEGFSYTLEYTVADIPSSPTPEPGTWGMLGSCAVLTGIIKRKLLLR